MKPPTQPENKASLHHLPPWLPPLLELGERLILIIGILSIFGAVCVEAIKVGHLDVLLLLVAGLVSQILAHRFGR